MRKVRGWAYALGFRPKLGSIFHSPSLNWKYAFREANVSEAFAKGLNNPNHKTLQKQIKENTDV